MDSDTILNAIKKHGTVNHLALAKQLNTTRDQINPILDTLEKQNHIKSYKPNGRKWYAFTGIKIIPEQNNGDSGTVNVKKVKEVGQPLVRNQKTISFRKNTATEIRQECHLGMDFRVPSTNDFKNPVLNDPWSIEAFDYWNTKQELTTHRKYNKTHQQILKTLDKLFDGTLFLHDDKIPEKYFRRKFTLDEFRQALDNFLLTITSETYEPLDKTKIKTFAKKVQLHRWLYNPYTKYRNPSLFLKYLNPPKKITAKSTVKVKSKEIYTIFLKLYTDKYFDGNVDKISAVTIDNIKIGINKLVDYFAGLYEPLVRGIYRKERAEMLWNFCHEELKNFTVKGMTEAWFWKKFDGYMSDLGLTED